MPQRNHDMSDYSLMPRLHSVEATDSPCGMGKAWGTVA